MAIVRSDLDAVFLLIFIMLQRLGSGDGERKTLLTRQMAFEPLPASVLFGLVGPVDALSVVCMVRIV